MAGPRDAYARKRVARQRLAIGAGRDPSGTAGCAGRRRCGHSRSRLRAHLRRVVSNGTSRAGSGSRRSHPLPGYQYLLPPLETESGTHAPGREPYRQRLPSRRLTYRQTHQAHALWAVHHLGVCGPAGGRRYAGCICGAGGHVGGRRRCPGRCRSAVHPDRRVGDLAPQASRRLSAGGTMP